MYHSYDLATPFTLDSWKGNSKMRPCFAAIRNNWCQVSDQELYDLLSDARSDRDKSRVETIMRDAVAVLSEPLAGVPADVVVEVTTEQRNW